MNEHAWNFICIIVYAQTLLTRTSKMSLILNFLTEISIIVGNPQALPQIRIDDVEASTSQPSSVPICAPHYNMQIRDMCSDYTRLFLIRGSLIRIRVL
jgi:hypothetical protein